MYTIHNGYLAKRASRLGQEEEADSLIKVKEE